MKAERARILDMLHQGAISVEQAEELLDALQRSYQSEASAAKPAELAADAPAGLNPFANPAEFGASIAQRVMQGLSGAFGALRGVGGAAVGGRANFSHTRLTNESLSRMADGTSYSNFGHLEIAEDVSAELLSQKIGAFTNFGAVTGPSNLAEIVEGRCDANFGAFGEDEDEGEKEADWEGPEQSNLGKTVLTREQLEHMADGTKFSNLGKLTVAASVRPELLAQKIARYENLGKTYGPPALIAVLQARCPENLGRFVPDGGDKEDDEEEDED